FAIFIAHQVERYVLAVSLAPLYQLAFKVGFGLLKRMDIDVRFNDVIYQEVAGKIVAFIQMNGTDQCFKSVAEQRSLPGGIKHPAIIFDQLIESQLARQLV